MKELLTVILRTHIFILCLVAVGVRADCSHCSSELILHLKTDKHPNETTFVLEPKNATACFKNVTGPKITLSSESSVNLTLSKSLCSGSKNPSIKTCI